MQRIQGALLDAKAKVQAGVSGTPWFVGGEGVQGALLVAAKVQILLGKDG